MKKLFILLLLALAMPSAIPAQDARNRANPTIITDVLAQLPAEKPDTYNQLMAEIAGTGAKGIEDLAMMLAPAAKGQNAPVEYALYGVTAYSVQPGHETARTAVRTGLKNALNKTSDNENRAFLLTLLQNCATADDATTFMAFLPDPYLQEWAVNGLISTPGTEEVLLGLVNTEAAPRSVMAKAAAKKGIEKAEPILLKWAEEAPAADRKDFYRSLSMIGSEKSLPLLSKAAKASNYAWEPDAATESYTALLNRMSESGNKKAAAKAARKLLKETDRPHVRAAALTAIFNAEGAKALPLAVKAMKDGDRSYRVNALNLATPYADASTYQTLNRMLADKKVPDQVKADIIGWYADNNAKDQIDNIIPMAASADDELAQTAIRALGSSGGDKALDTLTGLLGGTRSADATTALTHFNGRINPGIMKALDGDAATQKAALGIAAVRHMTEATPKILELAGSPDPELRKAAADALGGVAEPNDFNAIAQLAVNAGPSTLPALQNAMKKSLRNLSGEEQFNTVKALLDRNTSVPHAPFYPVLAQAGGKGVDIIIAGCDGDTKEQAFNALLDVDDPQQMLPILYRFAENDKSLADRALQRYAVLVGRSAGNPGEKSQLYCKALELPCSAATQNALINGLASTNTYQAFTTAARYLDNQATAFTAAEAVRGMASRNIGTFDGATMRDALTKAAAIFKAEGSADSGYAVDDINGMLSRIFDRTVN